MKNKHLQGLIETHHKPSDITVLPPAIDEMFKLYAQFGPVVSNSNEFLSKRPSSMTKNEYFDSDLRIHDLLDHLFLGVGLTIRGDSVGIYDLAQNHDENFVKEMNSFDAAIDTWRGEKKVEMDTLMQSDSKQIAENFLGFVRSKYGDTMYLDNLKTFIGKNFLRDWIHIVPKEEMGDLIKDQVALQSQYKSLKVDLESIKKAIDAHKKEETSTSGYDQRQEELVTKYNQTRESIDYLYGLASSRLIDKMKKYEPQVEQEKFFHFQLYNIMLDWFNRISPQLETMDSFPTPDEKCQQSIIALNEQFRTHPEQFNIPTDPDHIQGIQGIYMKRAKKAYDALKAIMMKYIDVPGKNEMLKVQYLHKEELKKE
jgi:hypothetical protein